MLLRGLPISGRDGRSAKSLVSSSTRVFARGELFGDFFGLDGDKRAVAEIIPFPSFKQRNLVTDRQVFREVGHLVYFPLKRWFWKKSLQNYCARGRLAGLL